MTNQTSQRRPFSTLEKAIIAVQGAAALVFGAYGFVEASDPDWGDLQRIVIVMSVGIWLTGIAGAAFLSRLVDNRVVRVVILLAVPFTGFVVLVLWASYGS